MFSRGVWLGVMMVGVSLGLAACSSGTPSASPTTSKVSAGPASKAFPATIRKGGSNPNSSFCKNLARENAAATKLSKGLNTATKSNKLATVQKAFESFLTATQGELAKVTGSATSAPTKVKIAFATVTSFYAQLKLTVAHATSIKQIQTAISGMARGPAITSAGSTISAYVTQQCGSPTTSST
ncbi:MAG: hypothetical protein ACYCV7_08040 [Acidimicrobiales bacterium]